MRYELIDQRPVPSALAQDMRELKSATGATLTSCLRNQQAVDFARAQGAHLMSQQELYDGFIHHLPGFNPANKPGASTHELRNDGAAYVGPARMPLRYWQVGQDWGSKAGAEATVRAAASRGWIATVTYPHNPKEQHHVNFRKEPKLSLMRVLMLGMKGPDVAIMTRRLAFVRMVHDHSSHYLGHAQRTFDERVETALKQFQRDHGQLDDGKYGTQTAKQLSASVRYEKKRRHHAEHGGGPE
ncbi:MAG: peptidoglycan-binding protein [Thermoleophilaceae bacterium]